MPTIAQHASGNFYFDIVRPGLVFSNITVTSATQFTLVNNADPNVTTVVTGTGFTFDATGLTGGTVTSIEFFNTGSTIAEINGLSVDGNVLGSAIGDAQGGDFVAFDAILDAEPADYSAATVPTGGVTHSATSNGDTILGSDGGDNFLGGAGNDSINPGDNSDRGDFIGGSTGIDTIIYSQSTPGSSYQGLGYFFDATEGITATVDGTTNTATVDKGAAGFDTIVDIANPLTSGGGFGIEGTWLADVFNLSTQDGQFLQVAGNAGDDTFNILTGSVRIDYGFVQNGIDVNLAVGTASNDGYGDMDTFTGDVWEIRGSDFDDVIVGSDSDESFIGREGDDIIDGGGGFDRLRFDRSGVADLTVNLNAGTASGTWNGNAFNYTVSNIERVEGSAGNDAITGSDAGETLKGRGGDDQLIGGDGTDELDGGDGNDLINPGDNSDYDFISGSRGDDTIVYSQNSGGFQSIGYIFFGALEGVSAIIDGVANVATVDKGGAGFDTFTDIANPLNARGFGIEGTDFADTFNVTTTEDQWLRIIGAAGNDTFNINSGRVRLDFRRSENGIDVNLADGMVYDDGFGDTDTINGDVHEIRASNHADTIVGSDNDESFIGLGGDDNIDGGGGSDRLRFDEDGASDVMVDLRAGTATGTWYGNAFSYTIANIERVFGSFGNDHLTGDDGTNELDGRDGNDVINPGSNSDFDYISGSAGDDTIIYTQSLTGYQGIGYQFFDATDGLTASINGIANTATVNKGADGFDTIVDIANPLDNKRFGFAGTNLADDFTITLNAEQWMQVAGLAGDDRIHVESGSVRVDYKDSINGIDVNLAVGRAFDDGFGDSDRFEGAVSEIQGSEFADMIVGSDHDESFIGRDGDDDIDGGGGFDRVRYDNGEATDVNVDLQAGTATGTWDGDAFTHTLSNIENATGSTGDDLILGNDGTNELNGREGDDIINPGDNSDYDYILGWTGNDSIIYSQSTSGYQGLSYRFYNPTSGLVAKIDGATNTATVDKGPDGLDTITDIANPLDDVGFGIEGTVLADEFNITNLEDQWMQVEGGAGDDVINVTSGLVRLDYKNAAGGVHVNLATGITSDDGFGDTDTFSGFIADVRGSAFADTIVANGGSHEFTGGDEHDTVVYEGERSEFGHDLQDDGSILVDKAGGDTDTLIDIERIDFTDGDLIYDLVSPNVGLVYRIYEASFDRTPDEGGLRFWTGVADYVEANEPWRDLNTFLANQFVGSDEFTQLYGANPSNGDYIDAMYLNVLDRLPDQGGRDYWVGLLDQGYSQEGVLIQFAQSDENRDKTAADLDDGVWVV